MYSLNDQLTDAVEEGKVPHVVVSATNRDGSFEYTYAVGKVSVEESATDIQDNAVFLLASQSKLLTAVAALQVVEGGLIGLDDDVGKLLPELARQPVLRGFDSNDLPILEERRAVITFRHLLTHTAGTAFDGGDANLIKYQSQRGTIPNTGSDVLSRFQYPLVFQPGEKWTYGTGMDWAGLLIERLTELTLEDYMAARIWNPLGLETMTFFPSQRPDLEARVPLLSVRVADGTLSPFKEPFITTGVTGCFGGQGIYSSMSDYSTFLHSLLANDGRLLCAESVDELFKPQLKPPQTQAQKEIFLSPVGALFIGEFEMEKHQHGWAIGGIVFVEGYEDGRRKTGAMSWGGAANCFWLMDREAGLALTFGTQLVPPGDGKVKELITSVEKEIYTMAGVK